MVGKAECMLQGENPRFLVTSLKRIEAQQLYEEIYSARGEMENWLTPSGVEERPLTRSKRT